MPLHQSTQNPFGLVDRTDEILLIPQNPTLMNDSGIWQDEYLSTRTVSFEQRKGSIVLINDQIEGAKPFTTGNDLRKLISYNVAHFPIMDALFPQDIAGLQRPGAPNQLDTKERALLTKMEKIRKSYDRTLNFARFRTLNTGMAYAPNGTISGDFYADAGVTRAVVNFDLATPGTDVMGKCEQIISGFQNAASGGETINRVLAYCSGGFFTALINHPKIQSAYNLYAATAPQQISRDRAGGMALHRRFTFGNIEFIEVTQSVNGVPMVDADKAIFVADDGDGSFKTYYSPANRFGIVNTVAEQLYMWTFEDPRSTQITIEAEMNALNVLTRPEFVATGNK